MTHPMLVRLTRAQIDYMATHHELNVVMEAFTRRVGMPSDDDTLALNLAAVNCGYATMQLRKTDKAIVSLGL